MPEYNKSDIKILKQLGKIICEQRDLLDLSQEQLAEKTKLHRTYISGIEQGRRNVSLLNIVKIAKALNLPLQKLFQKMKT